MSDLVERVRRLPPTALAFLGSLLLSLVAFAGTVTVGKDAALYLAVAQQALEQGPQAAFQRFDWPWFSLLLAGTHWLSALPLEPAAYLWCAFFMAATCALLVSVSERFAAGSGYWACLVVLSMPAFNHFRDDIIREQGFWFFCLLALSLALGWLESGGWRRAALIQLATLCACLFRLEAVLVLPAIAFCLIGDLHRRAGWSRLLELSALPLAAGVIAVLAMLARGGITQPRIAYYLSLLDPHTLVAGFNLMASQFASAALAKYSTDDAGKIIFFGVTATMLAKFFTLSGPLALPLLHPQSRQVVVAYWQRLRPFVWAWLAYFGVLFLFFIQQRFINSRYVSLLNLLAVPLLAVACLLCARSFPRLAKALVVAAVVVMLSKVISLGTKKTHYLEAASWLSRNTNPADPIYYEDLRIAYYAGRGYPYMPVTREELMTPYQAAKFRYFVLAPKPGDPLYLWLTEQRKPVLGQFTNRKGDTVVIMGH